MPFLCTWVKRLWQRDGRTPEVAIADEVYNEWLQEVKTLKPRKQKNWQSYLLNKGGAKSRVRFNVETGEFENYSPAHEARQYKKLSATWVQVTPTSRVREDKCHPISAVGHAFCVRDEAGVEAFMAAMQANYTGNHYRNHSVKGPTAPGEPVRG